MITVYGTIEILDDNFKRIHKFEAQTKIAGGDPYEAMDKAIEIWRNMFSQFKYVDIDDIYAH